MHLRIPGDLTCLLHASKKWKMQLVASHFIKVYGMLHSIVHFTYCMACMVCMTFMLAERFNEGTLAQYL